MVPYNTTTTTTITTTCAEQDLPYSNHTKKSTEHLFPEKGKKKKRERKEARDLAQIHQRWNLSWLQLSKRNWRFSWGWGGAITLSGRLQNNKGTALLADLWNVWGKQKTWDSLSDLLFLVRSEWRVPKWGERGFGWGYWFWNVALLRERELGVIRSRIY